MPAFSTTTDCDEVVTSAIFMATMKKYFSLCRVGGCSLPSVKLLGCRADWEIILTCIDKLPEFGEQLARWHTLLRPIISPFIKTFDAPEVGETKDFW
jgi:Domain of unknown function (DUF4419)